MICTHPRMAMSSLAFTLAALLSQQSGAQLQGPPSLQKVMTCPRGEVTKTTFLCNSQYSEIVEKITGLMQDFEDEEDCTNDKCLQADFAGCVLRSAGHDFMDFRNDRGGSDGCLNFDEDDNKGLINCLTGKTMIGDTDPDVFGKGKTLHDVYKEFCDVVSLADFLVIAAEAVMGFTATSTAVDLKADFASSFKYGRSTSKSCQDNVALPNPADGCKANEVTFISAFGMTWRQTAALMGVHSLGKATLENSGYKGWWQDENNNALFNNNYYISIVNKGWSPSIVKSGNKTKSQWTRQGVKHDDKKNEHPEMMLNTDMCLAYKDVTAEDSKCCAWMRFPTLKEHSVADTHEGTPIMCGFLNPFDNINIERDWCCGTNTPSDCVENLQSEAKPEGPAIDAVLDFAADEAVWLREFKLVWKLATEKGVGPLKELEQICTPTPTPTPTYIESSKNSVICPRPFLRVHGIKDCKKAAKALGKTWGGKRGHNKGPVGCYRQGRKVRFNKRLAGPDNAHRKRSVICKRPSGLPGQPRQPGQPGPGQRRTRRLTESEADCSEVVCAQGLCSHGKPRRPLGDDCCSCEVSLGGTEHILV